MLNGDILMEETNQYHKQISLAAELRRAREASGLSIGALARDSGVNKGVISRMESGTTISPQRDTLSRLSDALEIDPRELHRAAGYLEETLPSLPVYVRDRYRDLPEEAVTEMERYAERLQRKYGVSGPTAGEDEQPEDGDTASEPRRGPTSRRRTS